MAGVVPGVWLRGRRVPGPQAAPVPVLAYQVSAKDHHQLRIIDRDVYGELPALAAGLSAQGFHLAAQHRTGSSSVKDAPFFPGKVGLSGAKQRPEGNNVDSPLG